MLITLFEIKIVEKNVWGLFIKNWAYFAARVFFLALNSIFNLFETTKASSEDEKNPLAKRSAISPKISKVIF